MLAARTMAHFATDPRFAELEIVGFEPSAFHVSQLAGVAGRAVGHVACGRAALFPIAKIAALRPRSIDALPTIDPLPITHVVLERKDLKLAIRQARHITLLPFRADGVIDGIPVPEVV